jgi:zinc-binding alcohol dehydrogenase family protein
MKAVGLRNYLTLDHPESLLDVELPKPIAQGHDVLVAVRAVAVNPADTKERVRGGSKTEDPPRVLGWDAAGVVESVGESVTLFRPGDEVYYAGALTRSGTNAEFQLVDERIVGRKPKSLSFAQAAALPLTSLTAWEALFDRVHIDAQGKHRGRSVLIVGGAGGVGSIAIQLSKKVAGLKVIATASRPESEKWCRELGADDVVNHNGDLLTQLKTKNIAGVDYAFITNDPDKHFASLAEALLPQGLIVSILPFKQPPDMTPLFRKSAGVVWELMFTRPLFGTSDMIEQHHILNRVADLVDSGVVRTTLHDVVGPLNAANLKRAHAKLESGQAIGKIVLEGF